MHDILKALRAALITSADTMVGFNVALLGATDEFKLIAGSLVGYCVEVNGDIVDILVIDGVYVI